MESLVFNTTIFSLAVLILVTTVFLFAQIKSDNSLMDIAYGPIFLFASICLLLVTQSYSPLSYVMLACLSLWSLRLGIRIFKKNYGKPEDVRYATWRTEWSKKGRLYFLLRSYFQISLLQGFIIVLVSLPFIISTTNQGELSGIFLGIGLVVFLAGFTIESLADWQLDSFIARKKAGTETATIMTAGLFKFSRRPNYFGETLIWWGLALMVLPLPFGFLALLSPLLITYIVTKVTGPMLEKVFLEKYPNEYAAYQKQTSYFIPLPPRA